MSSKVKGSVKSILPEGWDFDRIMKVLYIIVICLCGMLMRNKLMPHTSRDMEIFLQKWFDYFREHGGFRSVGDDIGDYTPMYYYFLAFLTYFKTDSPQTGIKILSIIFDFITAIYAMWIVEINRVHSSVLPAYRSHEFGGVGTVRCDILLLPHHVPVLYAERQG